MDSYIFRQPREIFYGQQALLKAAAAAGKYGQKALLISDKNLAELGYINKVKKIFEEQKLEIEVFAEINSEPDDLQVEQALNYFKAKNCDFIIALGGGSPIDTAKAVAIMLNHPGHIRDYQGLNKLNNQLTPVIAIPTTAGTGSEATQYTVINDLKNDVKMLIGDPRIIPEIAVVDPELTLSVPAQITAATAFDALTHAIEGYTSVNHQPLTDTLALSAVKRIFNNLETACQKPADLQARTQLALAALEAGMVINNSSVTIVHGMSRPLGALYHLPHGLSNAVLLTNCLEYAASGAPDRFAEVARAIGVEADKQDQLTIAQSGIAKIKELAQRLNIPENISQLEILEESYLANLDKMATDALASGSPANTYQSVDQNAIIEIYKKLTT